MFTKLGHRSHEVGGNSGPYGSFDGDGGNDNDNDNELDFSNLVVRCS
jgi:hypothetical protein